MGDYAQESTTTFIAQGHAQHGFDWIRRNYEPAFGPGAIRDSLRFEEVEARALGANYILATARYVLSRGDSITSSGPFTLVLRRTGTTWRIIHDHTSRD
jgi:ketosteroid isomerase-like protein